MIELLVVIGVVALLLALALPSLVSARRAARDTRSGVNCKQLATAITMFGDKSGGKFPIPMAGQSVPTFDDNFRVVYPYWDLHRTWSGVMYDDLQYIPNLKVFLSPHAQRDAGELWPSSYTLTLTTGAPSALWTRGVDQSSVERAVMRHQDVSFPSRKAMLWDVESKDFPSHRSDALATQIAFMDSSVRTLVPRKATVPVENTTNDAGYAQAYLHNTELGLGGVDY
jgi:type II secretory pathway pseudopilin PulG